jgi:hypothetical protein
MLAKLFWRYPIVIFYLYPSDPFTRIHLRAVNSSDYVRGHTATLWSSPSRTAGYKGKHRRFWIVRKMIEAVAGIETVMNTVELLLGAGRLSYLTLACQNKRFLVHRKIVRSKSPVWTAATDGSFKVRMCSQNISLNTHIMCRKLRRRRSQWTSSMHLLSNLRSRICTLAVT